jgi:hypothetical protein
MERRYIRNEGNLSGYDSLRIHQANIPARSRDEWSFAPNTAYDTYLKIPKAFVDRSGSELLENIAKSLEGEWMPGSLNAAGWAVAEAALVQKTVRQRCA